MNRSILKTALPLSLLGAALLFGEPALAGPPDGESVTMGLGEFLRLYEEGRTEKPEKAPHDWAISSAEYKGSVLLDDDASTALFKAKMRVEVLKKDGWARVPLLPATVALQSAKSRGGEPAIVIENGFYTLVTDKRGVLNLDVEFAAAVATAEGSSSIDFALAPSGSTSLELTVPADESLDFTVANAKLKEKSSSDTKRTVTASLSGGGSLSMSWKREIPDTAKVKQPRTYAEVYTLVGLGEGVMRTTTTIQHTIMFAGRESLSFVLPADMTILDVKGTGIRDWTAKDGKLEVMLNYAAEGSYELTVEMERVVGEEATDLSAPLIRPVGAERSKGWVGVESRGNLEIAAGTVEKATSVDVRSLPAAILGITSNPVLLGFKYLDDSASVPLELLEHDDVDVLVTLLDQTQARTMWTREGRRLTSVKYQVRNNRKQFLELTLPKDSELWSASVGGRAVQPAKNKEGNLLVPLVRSQASGGSLAAFEAEVVYVESGEAVPDNGKGSFNAKLPVTDVPSTYVAWTLYAPEGAKVRWRSVEGNMDRVDYLSNPIPAQDMTYIETDTPQMAQTAGEQSDNGGLGQGAAPVKVNLPLQGTPIYFEKLLSFKEGVEIEFEYRGIKRRR